MQGIYINCEVMIEWLIIGVAVNRGSLNLNLLFSGMNNPNLLKYNKILFQARIWMILIVDYGGPDVKVVDRVNFCCHPYLY